MLFSKAIDFVDKLLRYDHQERPTAKEAMVKAQFLSIFIVGLCSVTFKIYWFEHGGGVHMGLQASNVMFWL